MPSALQRATSEKDAAYACRKAAQVSKQNIENKLSNAKSQEARISAQSDNEESVSLSIDIIGYVLDVYFSDVFAGVLELYVKAIYTLESWLDPVGPFNQDY